MTIIALIGLIQSVLKSKAVRRSIPCREHGSIVDWITENYSHADGKLRFSHVDRQLHYSHIDQQLQYSHVDGQLHYSNIDGQLNYSHVDRQLHCKPH